MTGEEYDVGGALPSGVTTATGPPSGQPPLTPAQVARFTALTGPAQPGPAGEDRPRRRTTWRRRRRGTQ